VEKDFILAGIEGLKRSQSKKPKESSPDIKCNHRIELNLIKSEYANFQFAITRNKNTSHLSQSWKSSTWSQVRLSRQI